MSMIRKISRKAHAVLWEQRTQFRRLRRLTQQALRAKERGDEATMLRLGQILERLQPELFGTPEPGKQGGMIAVEESDHEVIQKKPVDTDDS
jgi:hypothetical protein